MQRGRQVSGGRRERAALAGLKWLRPRTTAPKIKDAVNPGDRDQQMHRDKAQEPRPKLGRMYLPIPGYPGYFVGTDGSVWSSRSNENPSRQLTAWHILKKSVRCGRHRVHVRRPDGKSKHELVGWLALMAFKGPSPDPAAKFVRHVNEDVLDDCPSNLRWSRRPGLARRQKRSK